MMTELYLALTSLAMGQVYAPRPPQAPTMETRPAVTDRPPQAPLKSVLESDAVPAPKQSPMIFRWVEMETPAGAWGLYKDGGLIGLYRSSKGYQKKLEENADGDSVFELSTSEPPIALPEHLQHEARKRRENGQAAAPFTGDRFHSISSGREAIAEAEEQESRLLSMLPEGFQTYKRTNYSQRLAVTNNRPSNVMYKLTQDDHWSNSATVVNPNRQDPYRTPGGLSKSKGWVSRLAILFPRPLKTLRENVFPGGSGPVARESWRFPQGTLVADGLFNDKGEVFEIRMLEGSKWQGEWTPKTYYSDLAKAPAGYVPPRLNECMSCHKDAGDSSRYGISVRGSDGIFSFTPFKDGTFELDPKWLTTREGE